MRMNKEIKAKWVKALRSGRYKQGTGRLRARSLEGDLKYCCLGVLCNIINKNKWNLESHSSVYSFYGNVYALEEEILRKTKIQHSDGEIPGLTNRYGYNLDLIGLNDQGFTFNQIADIIEYFL